MFQILKVATNETTTLH